MSKQLNERTRAGFKGKKNVAKQTLRKKRGIILKKKMKKEKAKKEIR